MAGLTSAASKAAPVSDLIIVVSTVFSNQAQGISLGIPHCARAARTAITGMNEAVASRGQRGRMMTSAPAVQRASSLAPLASLTKGLGAPVEAVLEGTGLTPGNLLAQPFIPYDTYIAILRQAAALTGREDFGLLLGLRQTLATVGQLAEAVKYAATLGEALADFTAFQINNSTAAVTYLHRQDDWVLWGYGSYNPSLTFSPYVHDLVLGVGAMMLRELTGGAVKAIEYTAIRGRPEDPRPWQHLGAKVRFGEAETGIFIPVRDLSFPLPAADRKARDEALRRLTAIANLAPWGWSTRARHALRALLPEGRTYMPDIARHLDIHPRTLRRALAKEGTTFEELREEVRNAMARELLSMSSLAVADLALTLGYASPSAFIHAFQRWTGQSPAAWRKERQMAVPSPR
jgi:AraC-like DNA-binding protein